MVAGKKLGQIGSSLHIVVVITDYEDVNAEKSKRVKKRATRIVKNHPSQPKQILLYAIPS